jgi:hypothetical protein
MKIREKYRSSGLPLYTILIERSSFLLISELRMFGGTLTTSTGISVSTIIMMAVSEPLLLFTLEVALKVKRKEL